VHAILDGAADPGDVCTAVVSLDTADELELAKWVDWLHLSNVVAGLAEHAVITTTRTYDPGAAAPLQQRAGITAAPASVEALLEDSFDDGARALAATVAQKGHTNLVVGYEPGWADGTVIEIAWPPARVGILSAGADTPAEAHGWTLRRSTEWTAGELSSTLTSRAS
jgi:hypothetical protein